jgi:hypothetical protein
MDQGFELKLAPECWAEWTDILQDAKGRLASNNCYSDVRPLARFLRLMITRFFRYQATAVSDITTTVGYLTALISVLSQCLLPRAKFMMVMFYSLLFSCTAAALCCIGVVSAVKARQHTSTAETLANYNSSACAVSAIWLLFAIWSVIDVCANHNKIISTDLVRIANTFRASRPQVLQDPTVAFSIFFCITMTHAGEFVTISEGLTFIQTLLKAFSLGFAIATGVSLLIYPITCRRNVFKNMQDYLVVVQEVLDTQAKYLKSSQLGPQPEEQQAEANDKKGQATGLALASTTKKLQALHDGLHGNVVLAKGEIAWGKLSIEDLERIFELLRSIFLPLTGLSMLPDIFEKAQKDWRKLNRWSDGQNNSCLSPEDPKFGFDATSPAQTDTPLIQQLVENFESLSRLVVAGLEYSLDTLEIKTLPKTSTSSLSIFKSSENANMDEESSSATSGSFTDNFRREIKTFQSRRKQIHTPATGSWIGGTAVDTDGCVDMVKHELFVLLYIEYMHDIVLQATMNFVAFADSKVADGTLEHNRLIYPRNLFQNLLNFCRPSTKAGSDDQSIDEEQSTEDNSIPQQSVDPEHLPATNSWERAGDELRKISHFLASDNSIFGFRVAAASFTVAILAYLHQTQNFFFHQRLIWAMIIIVIGMSPTAGASFFSFIGRIIATVISVILSLIAWYIVDGKTPGVIVFLYIANVFAVRSESLLHSGCRCLLYMTVLFLHQVSPVYGIQYGNGCHTECDHGI